MVHKDYYKILEVAPAASQIEIKKAYRRLALKYHPDKNFGNQLYEAKFREILEAYRILSDVKKRQDYNYQRNDHSHSYSRRRTYTPATPQTILSHTIELRKKVSGVDPNRMNKVVLYQQIQQMLSNFNVQLLQENNDPKINRRVIEELLFCSRFLPFVQVEKICFQLTALAGSDNMLYQRIYKFSKDVRVKSYWHRYKVIAVIIIAILLCYAIYFVSTDI
jgi:preprotein translocase subunit Sec63